MSWFCHGRTGEVLGKEGLRVMGGLNFLDSDLEDILCRVSWMIWVVLEVQA